MGTRYVEPRSSRCIREHVDGVEQIRIPTRRNWFVLLFLCFWICGWTAGGIAAMYQVNKSTISRRMAKARETLLERTRAQLERTLALPPTELDSLLEQLGPRLDLSLTSVLNPST